NFAAAKPDQAASTATTANRNASTMVISRLRPVLSVAGPFSAARAWCSAISFPTSPGDKPSGTAPPPQRPCPPVPPHPTSVPPPAPAAHLTRGGCAASLAQVPP